MKITKRQLRSVIKEAIHEINPGFALEDLEDRADVALTNVFQDILVGTRLGQPAVRDLIALRDRFGPVDMLLGIWHWGRKNAEPGFRPANDAHAAADTHLRSLNIDPEARRGAGDRAIAAALDQLFST